MTERSYGEGSIYKRSVDGRWYGALDVATGERRRVTVSGPRRRAVEVRLDRLHRRCRSTTDEMTVADWLGQWPDELLTVSQSLKRGPHGTYRASEDSTVAPSGCASRASRLGTAATEGEPSERTSPSRRPVARQRPGLHHPRRTARRASEAGPTPRPTDGEPGPRTLASTRAPSFRGVAALGCRRATRRRGRRDGPPFHPHHLRRLSPRRGADYPRRPAPRGTPVRVS